MLGTPALTARVVPLLLSMALAGRRGGSDHQRRRSRPAGRRRRRLRKSSNFVGITSSTEIAEAVFIVQLPLRPGPLWAVIDNLAFRPVAVELANSADLRLSAKQTPQRPRAGHRVTYNLATENRGPAPADATILTIDLDGLSLSDRATISAPGACTVSDATVTCALGRLGPDRGKKITIRVTPSAPATLTLRAAATSAAPDPTPSDATTTLVTSVR